MLRVNTFEQDVAARLLDFFGWRTPWHRALWTPGVRLMLREVLEATEAVDQHVMFEDSLKDLAQTVSQAAGRDPGSGDPAERKLLNKSLCSELKCRSVDYHTIETFAADMDLHYLERWSKLLAESPPDASVERTARAIASHLLDLGFSRDYLHRWWTRRVRHENWAEDTL